MGVSNAICFGGVRSINCPAFLFVSHHHGMHDIAWMVHLFTCPSKITRNAPWHWIVIVTDELFNLADSHLLSVSMGNVQEFQNEGGSGFSKIWHPSYVTAAAHGTGVPHLPVVVLMRSP